MSVIDFHTHAFPDSLAEHAITVLEAECEDAHAFLNGTVDDLLRSMDRSGIERSVICSIATRPSQFGPILEWSGTVAGDRIIPLPSLHPADPQASEQVRIIHEEGFVGLKLHPYYQDFFLDGEQLFPIYEQALRYDLLLVSHTGFDMAFPRERRCDPERICNVLERFPQLRFVATHLGAWEDWDEVERCLLGKPVYMELSFAFGWLEQERIRHILETHPMEHLLFGTDSPWNDQQQTLDALRALSLEQEREAAILSGNALRLLNL